MLSAKLTVFQHMFAQFFLPVRARKVPRFSDTDIAPPANHQELILPCGHALYCAQKVTGQNDIGVHKTEQLVVCSVLRGFKHIIEQRCTEFIARDLGNMVQAKFLCHMGGALVVTK